MPPIQPRAFNHVAVSVPDVDAAVKWYSEILGFMLFAGPVSLDASKDKTGQLRDVLGPTLGKIRVAHLASANGVGLELFESKDPPHQPASGEVEFWRGGVFHFCLTDPNVEGTASRIAASGGKQLSKVWIDRPPSLDYRMVYCQDPWGTVVELYSHPYELFQGWR